MIIKDLFQAVLFLEYFWALFSDTHSAMEGVMAEKVSLEVIFKDWCVCEVVVVGLILIE